MNASRMCASSAQRTGISRGARDPAPARTLRVLPPLPRPQSQAALPTPARSPDEETSMEQFVRLEGIAAPLLRTNIDTDQIIPAKFLVRTSYAGIGKGLFAGWRSKPDGSPDPDFILNKAPWTRAEILLADSNFGCG